MSNFESWQPSSAADLPAAQENINVLCEAAQEIKQSGRYETHSFSLSTLSHFASYRYEDMHVAIYLFPGYNAAAHDVRIDTVRPLGTRTRKGRGEVVTSDTIHFFEATATGGFRLDNIHQEYQVRSKRLNNPRHMERPKYSDTLEMRPGHPFKRSLEIARLERIAHLGVFTVGQCAELFLVVDAFSPVTAQAYNGD